MCDWSSLVKKLTRGKTNNHFTKTTNLKKNMKVKNTAAQKQNCRNISWRVFELPQVYLRIFGNYFLVNEFFLLHLSSTPFWYFLSCKEVPGANSHSSLLERIFDFFPLTLCGGRWGWFPYFLEFGCFVLHTKRFLEIML